MGILHDALASLRATADKAIEFAEPAKALAVAEDRFKAILADSFQLLEDRVAKLEEGAQPAAAAVKSGASDALTEIHDKFEELLARVRQVELHPALSVPALPPAPAPAHEAQPPAAPSQADNIAAAALAAAGSAQA